MKPDRSSWPQVLVIFQKGYHDDLVDLLEIIMTDFRLQMVSASTEGEVWQRLKADRVRLVMVAGWGTSPVNFSTGNLLPLAERPARGFDGLGLAKLVRKFFPRIPVIMTSGYCFSDRVLNQIDRLGFGFLPKPFTVEELAEIVLLLLWRGGSAARLPDEFFSSGRMNQLAGDSKSAARDFNRALTLRPADAEYLNYRSEARRSLGDAASALADADAAIRLNPSVAGYYCNRGLARDLSRNDAAAEADFTHSLRLQKQFHVYLCRSISRERLGNLAGAVADMNAAEQMSHPDPDFYERRGNLKKRTGDLAGSLDDYDQAERLRTA
jgi:DNA-binding NarL/FixJ family response regulator